MATRKRPKGTGGLEHLGGDRWRIRVTHKGHRRSRVFRARNLTEANRASDDARKALLKEIKDYIESGVEAGNAEEAERDQRQRWTVEQYVDYYFRKWAPHHLANTTRQRYRSIADKQIIPHLGKRRMSEITPTDLKGFYAKLKEPGSRSRGKGGLSGPTIWTVHSVVSAIFTFAVEDQKDFPENPARDKNAEPDADREPREAKPLSIAEVEEFVDCIRKEAPEYAVAVMLAARLGVRRGEALALRWCDVDFQDGTVTVRRAVTQTKAEGITIKPTKTRKVRRIPIDSDTVTVLKAIQREQKERRVRLGRGWQGAKSPDGDYISTTATGAVVPPVDFSNAFRTIARRNHLGHVSPHILRHSWVSQMIRLGFDAVTIASMTGHSSDVLYKTYAHAFDTRKREAIDALGKARSEARAAK